MENFVKTMLVCCEGPVTLNKMVWTNAAEVHYFMALNVIVQDSLAPMLFLYEPNILKIDFICSYYICYNPIKT
jgi:hypothetical protein